MKRSLFIFLIGIVFLNEICAQENSSITEKLKEKYSFVQYNDTYGGWYYVSDKVTKKDGACNKKGKLIVPCKYDWVGFKGDFYQIMSKVQYRDKWGACDINGKEIVPPTYEFCNSALNQIELSGKNRQEYGTENYIIVENDNGKDGLYSISGKELLACKYESINYESLLTYGYCIAKLNDKSGLYDKNGNNIIPHLRYGINLTKSDKTGKILAILWDTGLYELYDVKGEKITENTYNFIEEIHEGLMVCKKGEKKDINGIRKGGLYGYLGEDGSLVVPCKYEDASSFKDGVAQVKENGTLLLLTNPLTGTTLNKLNGGGSVNIKVDKDIPTTGKNNEELFAFIIACENYAHLSGADYSINDGKVFKEYCSKTLGLPEKSIRYYEDATLGNLNNAIQKIKDIADVYEGDAKILFYFSGLGATDPASKEAYLMPTDASLPTLTTTGYSVSKLMKQLNELNTQNTIVILDAPFSGTDKSGKLLSEHRGVALKCKLPTPQNKVVVCTGSNNGENTYSGKKYGHSLLTYALLDKLQQSKGACTIKEWTDYAVSWVKKVSLLEFDNVQSPQITVSGEIINKWSNIKF